MKWNWLLLWNYSNYICCTCKLSSRLAGCKSRSNTSCKPHVKSRSPAGVLQHLWFQILHHYQCQLSLHASDSVAHSPVTIISIYGKLQFLLPQQAFHLNIWRRIINYLFHEQDGQIWKYSRFNRKCNDLRIHFRGGGRFCSYFCGKQHIQIYMSYVLV